MLIAYVHGQLKSPLNDVMFVKQKALMQMILVIRRRRLLGRESHPVSPPLTPRWKLCRLVLGVVE